MNSLTTKKRKIMQFSLAPESQKILEQFNKKYGTNKSLIIDRALQILAGKFHTTITIHYEMEYDQKQDEKTIEEIRAQIRKDTEVAKFNIWDPNV